MNILFIELADNVGSAAYGLKPVCDRMHSLRITDASSGLPRLQRIAAAMPVHLFVVAESRIDKNPAGQWLTAEIAQGLRDAGYRQPIMALSTPITEAAHQRLFAAGVTYTLPLRPVRIAEQQAWMNRHDRAYGISADLVCAAAKSLLQAAGANATPDQHAMTPSIGLPPADTIIARRLALVEAAYAAAKAEIVQQHQAYTLLLNKQQKLQTENIALRRQSPAAVLPDGNESGDVMLAGRRVFLGAGEQRLIEKLLLHKNKPFDAATLNILLYGKTGQPRTNGVQRTVFRTNQKIRDAFKDKALPHKFCLISHRRGMGWLIAGSDLHRLAMQHRMMAATPPVVRAPRMEPLAAFGLCYDPAREEASFAGAPLKLTPSHRTILRRMLKTPDQAVSIGDLNEALYKNGDAKKDTVIRNFVSGLHGQLQAQLCPDAPALRLITPQAGTGWRLQGDNLSMLALTAVRPIPAATGSSPVAAP